MRLGLPPTLPSILPWLTNTKMLKNQVLTLNLENRVWNRWGRGGEVGDGARWGRIRLGMARWGRDYGWGLCWGPRPAPKSGTGIHSPLEPTDGDALSSCKWMANCNRFQHTVCHWSCRAQNSLDAEFCLCKNLDWDIVDNLRENHQWS